MTVLLALYSLHSTYRRNIHSDPVRPRVASHVTRNRTSVPVRVNFTWHLHNQPTATM